MTDTTGPDRSVIPPDQTSIDATFRSGSLTSISIMIGFSLSFLTRWASSPGGWTLFDIVGLTTILIGIAFQLTSLSGMLSVRSLTTCHYLRFIRSFQIGTALVVLGVLLAIGGDLSGYATTILRH